VINDPPAISVTTAPVIPSIDPEHTNATFVTNWQADIRSVPPAKDPSGRGADVIYTPANQTKKRVFIRSIWCLNQGIMQ
jgi:hypothetical protein